MPKFERNSPKESLSVLHFFLKSNNNSFQNRFLSRAFASSTSKTCHHSSYFCFDGLTATVRFGTFALSGERLMNCVFSVRSVLPESSLLLNILHRSLLVHTVVSGPF